jgi:hypothetical protein
MPPQRTLAIMKDKQAGNSRSVLQSKDAFYPCVEGGVWTPIPNAPPTGDLRLNLKDIDLDKSERVKATNRLTYHAVGCSGCYEQYPDGPQPGPLLAKAMGAQAATPGVYAGYALAEPASFLYHLGDIVYKEDSEKDSTIASDPDGKDQAGLYNMQFYTQYDSTNPRFSPSQEIIQQILQTLGASRHRSLFE